jgi:NADPH:quinone reductase-like Zn-dependent oxidoreductase
MSENIKFKSVQYSYKEPLHLQEHDLSELTSKFGADDILVKVKAAAINPIDIMLYNTARYIFFKRHEQGFAADFSGVVLQKGANVKRVEVGDRIAGAFGERLTRQGTLSEYLLFNTVKSKDAYAKIPDSLSFVDAASFPLVFATAYGTLKAHHEPSNTTRALVYGGATSVGGYVIQLLKNHYNAEFIVSVNSSKSAERVKEYGADVTIDYKTQDVAREVTKIVEESGKKFDLIVDTVGTKVLFPDIEKTLKSKHENAGYVSLVGDHVADYRNSIFGLLSFSTIKRILFPKSYNYQFAQVSPGPKPIEFFTTLYQEGKVKVTIDSVHSLKNFQDAIDRLINHTAAGKVVVNVEEE